MRKFLLLQQFILIPLFTLSQDTIQLDEVIVTASRIPMENYKSGRSVEIITSETLKEMPVSTIDEMLRYLTGVNLNTRNGFGVQSDIGIRGSTFSQVLVLVDNVRFNDPLTAHFNNNIPVALSEIDHIEIIRGPAGSSFGSDAVGGLIHVKTKTYVEREMKNSLKVTGDVAKGEHNLQSSDIGIILNKNKFIFSVSYKSNIADGEQFINPNFIAGNSDDSLYNNFFDIRTYSASASYLISDSIKIYTRIGYDYRNFNAKYFYTRSTFDESIEKTENLWTQFALQYRRKRNSMELNGGYKIVDDFFDFNPLFAPNEHQTIQTFINFLNNYQINIKNRLAYGFQYLNKKIESTDRGDHSNGSFGVYGIYAKTLTEHWNINLSMRLEYDENFGTELLPQMSLSYRKDNFIIRSSFGRSVRAADFTERYVSSKIPNLTPGRNIGNPDLAAEKSNSIDLGFDFFLPDFLSFSSTIFYRKSKDLIDFTLINSREIENVDNLQDNADYFYADNIAENEVFGLELSLRKLFKISEEKNLNFQAGYSYLSTSIDQGVLSKYLANHPKHNVSLMIDFKLKDLFISSYSSFIKRQEESVESIDGTVPGQYFISNLKVSYDLVKEFSLYGRIINLTGTDYQEILGARPPGRWFVFGIEWDI